MSDAQQKMANTQKNDIAEETLDVLKSITWLFSEEPIEAVDTLETEDTSIDLPIEAEGIDSATIIQEVKELTATFEKLVLQISPQNGDPQEEEIGQQGIGSFYDLYRLWQEQVANLATIQNMQAEDFQKQLLEMDRSRQKLLDDLKNQEETHMQEMKELKRKLSCDLEAKDKICLELEHQLFRLREDNELNVSCSICLDPWAFTGHHRLVALSCGHLFGDPCIREYLQKAQLCPNCRAYASSNDIRYLYGRPS